jgi:protein-disulfide isomerase/uncharacterized membrane protein
MNPLLLLTLVPQALAAEAGPTGSGTGLIAAVVAIVLVVAAAVVRKPAEGMILASAAGAVTAVYLTGQNIVATGGGVSICNISGTLNCDVVNTSPYAKLFGVSIALYGLGFYAGMGYLAMQSRGGRSHTTPALLTVGAAAAVAYDLFLAWKSYEMGALCIFCAATWAFNVLLLVGALRLSRQLEGGFGAALGRSLGSDAGPAAVAGMVVFLIGVLVVRSQAGTPGAPSGAGGGGDNFVGMVENVRGRIELDGTEPVRGDPSAKFTLVEWADYECPHCGLMAPTLKKVLDDNRDTKLLFKNYPLDQQCNPYVQRKMHERACSAAQAAECARVQGRFWELSEAMFGNQQYLGPDDLRFMAEKAGIELSSFTECLASPASLEAVKQDIEGGAVAQIDGTPAVFLLGAYGDRWVRLEVGPYDGERIHAFLAAARTGKPLPTPTDPEPYPD